jgi:hypothetical protein
MLLPKGAKVCPHCRKAQGIPIGAWIIAGIFILIGVSMCQSMLSNNERNQSASREVVKNSAWDGSVSQVESWLKENLKDPDSLKFVEWSPVSKTNDGGFTVRVKYRAKNSFGGYVVENKVFFLNSAGTVTNNTDY